MESAQIHDARVHPSEHPAVPRHVLSTLSEPKIHPSLGMAPALSATCSMGMGASQGDWEGVASPGWGEAEAWLEGDGRKGAHSFPSRGSADLGKGVVTEILGAPIQLRPRLHSKEVIAELNKSVMTLITGVDSAAPPPSSGEMVQQLLGQRGSLPIVIVKKHY